MGRLWFNIRFGIRHLQIGPKWPFVFWVINWSHVGNPTNKWFAIYTFFGKSFNDHCE